MKAELFITSVQNIYGGGSDDIGDFTWTGKLQQTIHSRGVHCTKHVRVYVSAQKGY